MSFNSILNIINHPSNSSSSLNLTSDIGVDSHECIISNHVSQYQINNSNSQIHDNSIPHPCIIPNNDISQIHDNSIPHPCTIPNNDISQIHDNSIPHPCIIPNNDISQIHDNSIPHPCII